MLSSWLRRHNKSNRNSKLVGITGVILVVVLILFIGLSSSKKTTCTLKSDQSKNGYVLETKYVIKSKINQKKILLNK